MQFRSLQVYLVLGLLVWPLGNAGRHESVETDLKLSSDIEETTEADLDLDAAVALASTSCPSKYPVCRVDGDCAILGAKMPWIRTTDTGGVYSDFGNYIEGYDALGNSCTSDYPVTCISIGDEDECQRLDANPDNCKEDEEDEEMECCVCGGGANEGCDTISVFKKIAGEDELIAKAEWDTLFTAADVDKNDWVSIYEMREYFVMQQRLLCIAKDSLQFLFEEFETKKKHSISKSGWNVVWKKLLDVADRVGELGKINEDVWSEAFTVG